MKIDKKFNFYPPTYGINMSDNSIVCQQGFLFEVSFVAFHFVNVCLSNLMKPLIFIT